MLAHDNHYIIMILHLLKTDWKRLRGFAFLAWLVMSVSVLPWLFPKDEIEPLTWLMRTGYGWSFFNAYGLLLLSGIATIPLAAVIGLQGLAWQAAFPIRAWQKLFAKSLSILLLLVVPQVALGIITMLVNGFSFAATLLPALSTGISLYLLYAFLALFANRCGSFWKFIPMLLLTFGLFLLLPIVPSISVRFGSLYLWGALNTWGLLTGPQIWTFYALSVIGMAFFPPLFGLVRGEYKTLALCVLVIAIASYVGRFREVDSIGESKLGTLENSSLQITLPKENITCSTQRGYTVGKMTVSQWARIRPVVHGLKKDEFITWYSPDHNNISPVYIVNYLSNNPLNLSNVLPAPLAERDPDDDWTPPSLHVQVKERWPSSLNVAGIVHRAVLLIDLPLTKQLCKATVENCHVVARIVGDKNPSVEIGLKSANPFSYSGSRFTMDWTLSRNRYAVVVYFPKNNICSALGEGIDRAVCSPGGWSWQKRTVCPKHMMLSTEGARLLIYQSVPLGVVQKTFDLPDSPPDVDFDDSHEERTTISVIDYYEKIRPSRPDPDTCSAEEFENYLRKVCLVDDSERSSGMLKADLAEYVARFPDVIVRSPEGKNYRRADVLKMMPESSRKVYLDSIDTPQLAIQNAEVIFNRGWTGAVREPLLKCLQEPFFTQRSGEVWQVITALCQLEDFSTYPTLANAYKAKKSTYYGEIICKLPGIEPELDRAMAEVVNELPVSALEIGGEMYEVNMKFDEFEFPIRQGNKAAFEKLLSVWHSISEVKDMEIDTTPPMDDHHSGSDSTGKGFAVVAYTVVDDPPNIKLRNFTRVMRAEPAIPHRFDAWAAFLKDKSADDFTYDPLLRVWSAPSQ